MKKFFKRISTKFNSALASAKCAVTDRKAEGYVDTGVKILIAVVVGALVLSLIYSLFNTSVMPTVSDKILNLFNYKA